MDTLFVRLGAIYGHVWWSSFQNEKALEFAKKEWSDGLMRFDKCTLKESLLKFRESKGFPPTLPQFIECCKAIMKRKEDCSPAPKPTPKCRSTVAEKHLKAMLDLLRR